FSIGEIFLTPFFIYEVLKRGPPAIIEELKGRISFQYAPKRHTPSMPIWFAAIVAALIWIVFTGGIYFMSFKYVTAIIPATFLSFVPFTIFLLLDRGQFKGHQFFDERINHRKWRGSSLF